MDERTNRSVEAFLNEVAHQNADLVTAYLFGSFAQGKQKRESDIDLALVIRHLTEDERFDVQVQLMMLAADFDTRIEPHPIAAEDFNSGNSFAIEIKNTGTELRPWLSEQKTSLTIN